MTAPALRPELAAVKALFARLVELPLAERQAALARSSASPGLLREVQELLAQHDAAERDGGFLDHAPPWPEAGAPDRCGERLGPWRLTALLGEGGMGEVWAAERDDGAYEARVAVKLLPAALASDQRQALVLQETRALARLNHPHIARLLDAGRSADGRPYFVMEAVDGRPLDEACDGLPLDERLRLFLQLADAVAYAHRQLLVHRDLKPANVLVDGAGQIKLLDFGIAKALDALDAPDGTPGQGGAVTAWPLTAHCASPEQVRGEPVGVATDVYSLGVLLYGLLTGERPYGRGATDLHATLQAVLDEAPQRPSAALPPRSPLARRLRGDLDRILLKALAKPVADRYASVDALAGDLRAWLDGRPVSVTPARPGYLLRRFVARHRAGVAGAGVAALALLGALGALLHQVHETEAARQVAERRFSQARQLAHRMVFDHHEAIVNLAGAIPAREALLADAERYLTTLSADVGDDAVLARELAETYFRIAALQGNTFSPSLERLDAAEANLDRALKLQPLYLARPDTPLAARLAAVDMWLARSEVHTRRARPHAALAALEQARPLAQALQRERPQDLQVLSRLATLEGRLGLAKGGPPTLAHLGRMEEAGLHYARSTALMEGMVQREPAEPEWQHQLGWALANQQLWLLTMDRLAASRAVAERALSLRHQAALGRPGDAHLAYQPVIARVRLGTVLSYVGEHEAARRLLDEAHEQTRQRSLADPANRQFGRDLAILEVTRGRAAVLAGRPAEGLRLLDAALQALPPAKPDDFLLTHWHAEAQLWRARALPARDATGALRAADAALALVQATPADPANAPRRWLLARAQAERAAVARRQGDTALAASAQAAASAAWGDWVPPLYAALAPRSAPP